MAHMHGARDSEAWEFARADKLEGLEFEKAHVCGSGAHNVFRLKGELLCLNSNRGQVVALGDVSQVRYQGPRHCLLRGVCRAGAGLVVGCSALQLDRTLRRWVHGDLLVWPDGDLGKEPVVHEMGQGPISDVRCLDQPDAAHWPNEPFWR
jgi:hypothetical protein